jgi:hypothetical protein
MHVKHFICQLVKRLDIELFTNVLFNKDTKREKMINFDFDEKKATQVTALLLTLNNNELNYTKLIKLLYVLDRVALKRFDWPVIGDEHYSLEKGPILSKVLNLIKQTVIFSFIERGKYWHKFIKKSGYNIQLKETPDFDEISLREKELIKEMDEFFKNYSYQQMIDYCHILPEYVNPNKVGEKRIDLSYEEILIKIDKTPYEISTICENAELSRIVNSINSNL